MQTPYLPKALFEVDFQSVYEPAEDTFLLLDALETDLDFLKSNAIICMECGSGSGTIITALSKALDQEEHCPGRSRLMLATDINRRACRTTRKCADYHKQLHNIEVLETNLAESLVDRLEHAVDLLVFNPPYVPTEASELVEGANQLQYAWAGGERGRKLIDIFLNFYVPRLLSKPNGVAYMVALAENDISQLCNLLVEEHSLIGESVMQRRAGSEMLHILKYRWNK